MATSASSLLTRSVGLHPCGSRSLCFEKPCDARQRFDVLLAATAHIPTPAFDWHAFAPDLVLGFSDLQADIVADLHAVRELEVRHGARRGPAP